ncbi:phage tail tip lysozyme [Pseudomonas nitroreducens]|uniref:phage tail tip lysozyme n=1 Tax=Pseudomonas nitroreducens TaxID=46680 RepID=UPI002447CF16|nr:phage tail tip lysozyme [Pseudomonas nitroreducens]MDG9858217.1 phage tail tip lysozyme [Pseudomonas nitroreducens]
MSESSVIKEFLVGLGFKVDEKGLKTFTGTIDGATTAVTRLVTTLAGASLTIAAGVSAFASNLEDLYFASQRIGSSADSIKAAEYAARDFGASAGELRGSLEGIARFLRDNPGGEGFLKSLGVETRDIQGNIKDTADLLTGLGQRLRNMPWYQARQYASVLGIDENTLRAIMSGEFGRKLEENRKRFAGAGLDKATRDAHEFMNELRDVGMQFESMSILVQAELMHRLGPELERFSAWFEKNSPLIAKRIVDVTEKLIQLAQDSEPYLKAIYEFFVDLDEATDGWSTKIIVLLGLMKALGMTSVVTGILKLAAAFFRLGTGITGASAAAGAAGAISTLAVGLGAAVYSSSLNEGEDEEVARIRRERGLPEHESQTKDQAAKESATANAWRILQGVDKDKSTFAMDFFKAQGWSDAQAAGLVANLAAESNLDPTAKGDWGLTGPQARGIGQWHPDRQQAFKEWAGFPIWDQRADLMKQLEFVQHELTQGAEQKAGRLLQASQNASEAGAVVSRYYERPAAADAEAAKRGAMAMQLDQKTEIHVHGSGDANSTAQAVAGAQGRVNEELVRNMTSAVQ